MNGNKLSAVEQVVQEIRSGIRRRRYVPGQRLVESDLTESLSVSRGTVRDALRRLEAEGLVQFEKFRGARIRKMSRRDIAELNNIRAVLEGYAAALAASRATQESLQPLLELESYWETHDPAELEPYSAYNTEFHSLIVRISDCGQLPHFIDQTSLSVFRLQFDFALLSAERISLSREEHRRIVAAIAAGDAEEAERAMRDHVNTSTRIILGAPDDYFH